jgi:RNA polymerase sigma factor (sigma-70 family)
LSTAAHSPNDSHLTRGAVRGSSRAFEAIFERYHQELYRYCAAIVGNSADAQDAVQSTMVKVLQALPGERRRIELKPWLYRIAHNEAIEIVRKRMPGEEVDPDSLIGPGGVAEEAVERERLRRLVADIGELPERQRGALVMRELGGLSFEEIGAALGTSAAAARQTLYEARLGLRQIGEGREMDCAEAMRAISDGDRRLLRRRRLRAHLRACENCRAFREGIESRRGDLALLAPLPAAVAAGILHGALGGAGAAGSATAAAGGAGSAAGAAGGGSVGVGAAGGGSVAGGVGAATGKSLLGAAAVKSAAAVGVVVALGVTAADQRGLIHLGSGHSEAPPPARSAPPRAGAAAGSRAEPSVPAPGAAGASVGRGDASGAGGKNARSRRRARGLSKAAQPARGEAKALPSAPAAVPGSPPARAENGRRLGQSGHPGHGHGAPSSAAESHGKAATAPGHAKSKPPRPRHHPAAVKAPPGQAKESPPPRAEKGKAATSAPPVATAGEPAQPDQPRKAPAGAEPAAEGHGDGGQPSGP